MNFFTQAPIGSLIHHSRSFILYRCSGKSSEPNRTIEIWDSLVETFHPYKCPYFYNRDKNIVKFVIFVFLV